MGLFKNKHLACLLACLCLPPSDSIHAFSACFVVEPQRLCLSLLDRAIGATCKRWKLPGKRSKKSRIPGLGRCFGLVESGTINLRGCLTGSLDIARGLTKVLLPPSSRSIIAINMKGCLRRAEWIKAVGPVGSRGELRPFWTITSRSSKSSQLARVPRKCRHPPRSDHQGLESVIH